MITVRPIIRTGKQNKQGLYNIYLEINKNGKREFFSLDKYVRKEDWDSDNGKAKRSHPNSKRLNAFLEKQISITEENIEKLEKKSLPVESKKLKQSLKSFDEIDFVKFAEENLKRSEKTLKIGSFRGQTAILQKLKDYLKEKPLPLDQVNVRFLNDYEVYLRDKLSNTTNTVHNNLKTFRKWIIEAVRQDLLPYEKNPFLKFKLKRSPTNKVFLTEEELKRIEDLDLKPDTMLNHHRNMYVTSCYLGLRISDVLLLKWKNIDGDMLSIKVHKTQDELHLKIPNKVLGILEFYRPVISSPNNFVFPVLKQDLNYENPEVLFKSLSSSSAYVNKDLRKIGKKARINKHISFHTGRVTFATRALRKGINLKIVSKLLNHKNILTTGLSR